MPANWPSGYVPPSGITQLTGGVGLSFVQPGMVITALPNIGSKWAGQHSADGGVSWHWNFFEYIVKGYSSEIQGTPADIVLVDSMVNTFGSIHKRDVRKALGFWTSWGVQLGMNPKMRFRMWAIA